MTPRKHRSIYDTYEMNMKRDETCALLIKNNGEVQINRLLDASQRRELVLCWNKSMMI